MRKPTSGALEKWVDIGITCVRFKNVKWQADDVEKTCGRHPHALGQVPKRPSLSASLTDEFMKKIKR